MTNCQTCANARRTPRPGGGNYLQCGLIVGRATQHPLDDLVSAWIRADDRYTDTMLHHPGDCPGYEALPSIAPPTDYRDPEHAAYLAETGARVDALAIAAAIDRAQHVADSYADTALADAFAAGQREVRETDRVALVEALGLPADTPWPEALALVIEAYRRGNRDGLLSFAVELQRMAAAQTREGDLLRRHRTMGERLATPHYMAAQALADAARLAVTRAAALPEDPEEEVRRE